MDREQLVGGRFEDEVGLVEFLPDCTAAPLLAEGGSGNEGDGMASRVGGRTQNWAPIALSGGKLLIRDQQQLKCIKVGE